MREKGTTGSTRTSAKKMPSGLPLSLLLLSLLLVGSNASGNNGPNSIPREARQLPRLAPFLEVFTADLAPPVAMREVTWNGVSGNRHGYLARQESDERLPALLLIADERGFDDWLLRSGRELADVGFVVFVVEAPSATVDEPGLADLSAAVRWLRRRDDVYPDRIGALGWAAGGEWAVAVAAANGLDAAVFCDAGVSLDPALTVGLRHTAVMAIWSGQAARELGTERIAEFKHSLDSAETSGDFLVFDEAERGFMRPEHPTAHRYDDAERAWFEIYEFLGKHVEDAAIKRLLAARKSAESAGRAIFARIADLMRAVNAPTGVRGQLAQSLAEEPADEKAWADVRARAAVLVETAGLLEVRTPPRGTTSSWLHHAESYRDAAEAIHRAANERDYPAAVAGLERLGQTCGACHLEHR